MNYIENDKITNKKSNINNFYNEDDSENDVQVNDKHTSGKYKSTSNNTDNTTMFDNFTSKNNKLYNGSHFFRDYIGDNDVDDDVDE